MRVARFQYLLIHRALDLRETIYRISHTRVKFFCLFAFLPCLHFSSLLHSQAYGSSQRERFSFLDLGSRGGDLPSEVRMEVLPNAPEYDLRDIFFFLHHEKVDVFSLFNRLLKPRRIRIVADMNRRDPVLNLPKKTD